jgi:hypothetical protein
VPQGLRLELLRNGQAIGTNLGPEGGFRQAVGMTLATETLETILSSLRYASTRTKVIAVKRTAM